MPLCPKADAESRRGEGWHAANFVKPWRSDLSTWMNVFLQALELNIHMAAAQNMYLATRRSAQMWVSSNWRQRPKLRFVALHPTVGPPNTPNPRPFRQKKKDDLPSRQFCSQCNCHFLIGHITGPKNKPRRESLLPFACRECQNTKCVPLAALIVVSCKSNRPPRFGWDMPYRFYLVQGGHVARPTGNRIASEKVSNHGSTFRAGYWVKVPVSEHVKTGPPKRFQAWFGEGCFARACGLVEFLLARLCRHALS